jgi:hypothetical protein
MPFWDSRDSLSAPDDVKADKLMLAKIGRWASLVCQTGDAEYGYLISQKTASLMLQPNAPRCVWKSPIMDDLASAQPNLQSVSDTLIHDMKTSRSVLFFLSTRIRFLIRSFFFHTVEQPSTYKVSTTPK